MSHIYIVICPACRDALPVGKLVADPDVGSRKWSFGGWRIPPDEWLAGGPLLRTVEHFLIAHRGHVISMIPEDVILSDSHLWHDIGSLDEALNSPIHPDPDPIEDAARISDSLRDMLSETD